MSSCTCSSERQRNTYARPLLAHPTHAAATPPSCAVRTHETLRTEQLRQLRFLAPTGVDVEAACIVVVELTCSEWRIAYLSIHLVVNLARRCAPAVRGSRKRGPVPGRGPLELPPIVCSHDPSSL